MQNLNEKMVLKCVLAENGTCTNLYRKNYTGTPVFQSAKNFIRHLSKEFNIKDEDIVIMRDSDSRELKETADNLEEYLKDVKSLFIFSRSKTIDEKDEYEIVGSEQGYQVDNGKDFEDFLPTLFENSGGIKELIKLEDKNEVFRGIIDDMELTRNQLFNLRQSIDALSQQKFSQNVVKLFTYNYFNEKSDKYSEIFSVWDKKLQKFQSLTENIPANLQKLKQHQLETSLQKKDKKYLSDYFDIEGVEKSKNIYAKNLNTLKNKATEIKKRVKENLDSIKTVETTISDRHEELRLNCDSLHLEFLRVHNDCRTRFQDLTSKSNPSGKDVNDLVEYCKRIKSTLKDKILKTLEEKNEDAKKNIARNGEKIREFLKIMGDKHQQVKKEIVTSIDGFSGALTKIEVDIKSLGALENFPRAYDASLTEIRRRDQFLSDLSKFFVFTNRIIDEENRIRKEFNDQYLPDIPAEFCPQLAQWFPNLGIEGLLNDLQKAKLADLPSKYDPKEYKNIENKKLIEACTDYNLSLENQIKKHEQTIRSQQDKLDNMNLAINEQGMSSDNIKILFGRNEFNKMIEKMMTEYKQKVEKRLIVYERRIADLTLFITQRIKPAIKNKSSKKSTTSSTCNTCEQAQLNLAILKSERESDRKVFDQILDNNTKLENLIKDEKNKAEKIKLECEKLQKDNQDRNKLLEKRTARTAELEEELKNQQKKFDGIVQTLRTENTRLYDQLNSLDKNKTSDSKRIEELLKIQEGDKKLIKDLSDGLERKENEIADLAAIIQFSNNEKKDETDFKKLIEELYEQATEEKLRSLSNIKQTIQEITEALNTKFVKLVDPKIGDTVAAVRLPGPLNLYQVITFSKIGASYLIKGDPKNKNVVRGKVKKIDYFPLSSDARKKYPDEEYLLEVELEKVDNVNIL